MSLGQSMNIAVNSMKNNQYALTVVSHNIANANTKGYYRQTVGFSEVRHNSGASVISQIKSLGGATISSLNDYMDNAAFGSMIDSNSDAKYYSTLADALSGLESIADDLGDNGLNALLNDFYKAAANLEQFPTDIAIRQQYIYSAQNVCTKFNEISKQYDELQTNVNNDLKSNIDIVNSLLSDLAEANEAHAKEGATVTKGNINNILAQLSDYMDVSTKENPNGTVNLIIGGVEVVQGAQHVYSIGVQDIVVDGQKKVKLNLTSVDNPEYKIENNVIESFKSGSIKAYLDFCNGTGNFSGVNNMKSSLDSAAEAFALNLNNIQTYKNNDNSVFAACLCQDADGNTILEQSFTDMITTTDGSADFKASNICINQDILDDPRKIAAARIDLAKYKNPDGTMDDWTKSIGNSDNASEIMALQNKPICPNNMSLSNFLRNLAVKNGSDLANIEKKAEIYKNIADNDVNNYNNLIGVNMEEELADMIKYQRAFEASAKLFSTINSIMDTVLGMV